jgi:hypothetical protein
VYRILAAPLQAAQYQHIQGKCDMNQEPTDKTQKRRTVGQEAIDIFQRGEKETSPIELQREMTREYYQNLIDCALNNRRNYPGRFFIVVLTKNEKLLYNVFRNYFFARATCPTPDYDQSVFKYDWRNEEIHYLWTVPSKDACFHLLANAHLVVPEEQQLLQFVKDFESGQLYRTAKKLNKEKEKTPKLENREYIS